MSLKKRKLYRYQFKQFAFCHMALLVVVFQSTFLAENVFNGLLWYVGSAAAARAGRPCAAFRATGGSGSCWATPLDLPDAIAACVFQVYAAMRDGCVQRLLCVHLWLLLRQNRKCTHVAPSHRARLTAVTFASTAYPSHSR